MFNANQIESDCGLQTEKEEKSFSEHEKTV